MTTNPNLHTFTARMPLPQYEAVRTYAYLTGRSVNAIMLGAVRAFLLAPERAAEMDRLTKRVRDEFRATVEAIGD